MPQDIDITKGLFLHHKKDLLCLEVAYHFLSSKDEIPITSGSVDDQPERL